MGLLSKDKGELLCLIIKLLMQLQHFTVAAAQGGAGSTVVLKLGFRPPPTGHKINLRSRRCRHMFLCFFLFPGLVSKDFALMCISCENGRLEL